MSLWKVYGGNDAWARKHTLVEADTAEEANLLAGSRDFDGDWEDDGMVEFDHFEVFDAETVLYEPHQIDWDAVAKLPKPTMTAAENDRLFRGGDGHEPTGEPLPVDTEQPPEPLSAEADRFGRLFDEERDTVLAALRYYQLGLERNEVPAEILNISTNDGAHAGMELSDIDTLCEEINLG